MAVTNWQIEHTDYPAVRRVMGRSRIALDDDKLEHALSVIFPDAAPEDVESFMNTLQRFGKQAAPLAQKALTGAVKGGMIGGPMGAVAGAAISLAKPTPTSPSPSASPTPSLSPAPAPSPTPTPSPLPGVAASAAAPSTVDAAVQLLMLLSRPETFQALLALLLVGLGRATVQVGQREVPAAAFANAIAETAATLAHSGGYDLQGTFAEDLIDKDGTLRCDVVNPLERALLLVSDLVDAGGSEAAQESWAADEEEPNAVVSHYEFIDNVDPIEGYEDALNGRWFDGD